MNNGKGLLKEIKGKDGDDLGADEALRALATRLKGVLSEGDYTGKVKKKIRQASRFLSKLLGSAEKARAGSKKQKRKVKRFKKKAKKAMRALKKKL